MSEFLFKLNGVPDDEADDIRKLLQNNEIDFYETSAGKWGISSAAIWLKNKNQRQQASILIYEYQQDRQTKMKKEYEHLLQEGKIETFFSRAWQHPVQLLLYIALIMAILYISIKPFILFGNMSS
jgi:hypothetical protein